MATYAAYRHVELDKVGCGKRSIMKPPGGDSHDIFGAAFHGTPSHHRVLKPPGGGTSDLFASSVDDTDKARTSPSVSEVSSLQSIHTAFNTLDSKASGLNGKPGNDGTSEGRRELKNPDKDTQSLLSTKSSYNSSESNQLNYKRHRAATRNCVTGEGCQTNDHFVIRVHRQRDGNPVTGEGYDNPETQTQVPQRARIPPGGYSSGLW